MSISRLSLFKRSNGFWYILYYDGGKIRWKSTGARLKQDALKALSEFQALLKNKVTSPLFSDFVRQFSVAQRNVLRESTLQRIYLPSFKIFAGIAGNKALSSYSLKDVEDFKRTMLEKCSPTYVNILFRSLRAAFNLAVQWQLLGSNPFLQASGVRVPPQPPLFLTKEEFQKLLKVTNEGVLRDVFTFAA
ncbi:MAG: hypothetical protein WBD36_01995, partial [Bacteroidota bacterium]